MDLSIVKAKAIKSFKSFEEFKFSYISPGSIHYYKELIDIFFSHEKIMFCGLVIDKKHPDFNMKDYFDNSWEAHVGYAHMLVKNNIGPLEFTHVIADNMNRQGKKASFFETELEKLHQVIFAGMENSKNNLIVQLTDILIGCVVLDFKIKNQSFIPNVHKLEALNYLKSKLNCSSLAQKYDTFIPRYFSVWPFNPYHK
jgi:hypothetical protein